MDVEVLRNYCLEKPGVTEGFPFDNETLVFKVMNKMFALSNLEKNVSVNLKCDPERAMDLREEFEAVKPGWHMNKKHWNTVSFNMDLGDRRLLDLVDHSYELVAKSLKKADRELLQGMT